MKLLMRFEVKANGFQYQTNWKILAFIVLHYQLLFNKSVILIERGN